MEPTEPAPTDNGKLISDLTFAILDFANTPGTDGLFFNPDDKVTFFQCHTNAKLTGDFSKHSKLSVKCAVVALNSLLFSRRFGW